VIKTLWGVSGKWATPDVTMIDSGTINWLMQFARTDAHQDDA
jgi:hypothetical protein